MGPRAAVAGWSASRVSLDGVIEQRPGVGRDSMQVWGLPMLQMGLIPQFGLEPGSSGSEVTGSLPRRL